MEEEEDNLSKYTIALTMAFPSWIFSSLDSSNIFKEGWHLLASSMYYGT